jgi:hypothetical protein
VFEFDRTKENIVSVSPLPISANMAQALTEIAFENSVEVCREISDFSPNLARLLNCITKADAVNEEERNEMTKGFCFALKATKKSFETKDKDFPNILDKHFDKGLLTAINRKTAAKSLDCYIKEKIEKFKEIDPVFVEFILKIARSDTEKKQRNKFIHGATEAYLMVYLAFKEPF